MQLAVSKVREWKEGELQQGHPNFLLQYIAWHLCLMVLLNFFVMKKLCSLMTAPHPVVVATVSWAYNQSNIIITILPIFCRILSLGFFLWGGGGWYRV